MVDITDFRNGMAMLAGAVNIITTDGPQGLAGFTATAVCSVTDQPPTLLVCMNRASWAHPIFSGNGVLCVNVLGAERQDVSGIFADRSITMEERFARIGWKALATGSPLLNGARWEATAVPALRVHAARAATHAEASLAHMTP